MVTLQQSGGLQSLQRAVWAFRRLTLYRDAMSLPAFTEMMGILEVLAAPGTSANRQSCPDHYHSLVKRLAGIALGIESPYHSDPWKETVMGSALYTENAFNALASKLAEGEGTGNLPPDIVAAAQHDLTLLGDLYRVDCRWLQAAVVQTSPGMPRMQGMLPGWGNMMTPSLGQGPGRAIMDKLANSANWGECIADLCEWHRVNGCGLPSRYHALKWVDGGMEGIGDPDPIRTKDLEGYARQRTMVVDNTRRFMEGLPAQNLLLYGERGTGKSSTVKSLLWEFDGVRIVELDRWNLRELPTMYGTLGRRGERFIIFIDDLSFEDSETEYKGLKSAMEGSLRKKPANVLVYATSNRRHLVRETHSDRDPSAEVHGGDGLQEKLSLADRFGVGILYPSPDQAAYIEMVLAMALKAGIPMGEAELRSRAIKWASGGNGRSPRSARQFVDSCIR